MAREIHYQSVGNPIQLARLPRRKPELQLPYQPVKPAQELRSAGRLTLLLVILGMAVMVTELLHVVVDLGGQARLFSMINIAFLIAGVSLFQLAVAERTFLPLKLPVLCLIVAYAYMNCRLPFAIQLCVSAAAASYLTWHIGIHWLHLSTATGFTQSESNRLRRRGADYLRVMSLIPVVCVVAHFLTGSFLLPGLLLVTALIVQVVPVVYRHGRKSLRVGCRAAVSWLVYNRFDDPIPGTFSSPSGPFPYRLTLTGGCVFLSAIAIVQIPLQWLMSASADPSALTELATLAGPLQWLSPWAFTVSPEAALFWSLCVALLCVLPVLLTLTVPTSLILNLLLWANSFRKATVTPGRWKTLIDRIQCSSDPVERSSLYLGRVVADGSPLLVPRDVFGEHAHFLGNSGSGKTAMGLAPAIEQLITGGDCSVIVLDLKADTRELFSTLIEAARARSSRTGRRMPVKYFSNQSRLSTFAFNPLEQPCWGQLQDYVRTDILCGALGLTYGSDYGEGFYSSANAAVMYHTQKQFPETRSCRDLAERIRYVTMNADKRELHPEIRKAGVHVQTVLDRLGSFEALNVSRESRHPQDVADRSIDLTDVFREPQVLYFHLSSTLAPGSSPEIARLATYMLLAASTQAERKHPVYLVIDEFQRMVARNIEYMLQLARSMGVGVILANQSMQDLKTATADLIPAIEANCRYRQWFSVSAAEDQERLIASSGETVDYMFTETESQTPHGLTIGVSKQERVSSRLTINDILLASDHPHQSIVQVSRGSGYAQFGGMPFVLESDFHITAEEYERRKSMPWPCEGDGAFLPGTVLPGPAVPPIKPGPVVTTEVIDPSGSGKGKGKTQASGQFESFLRDRKPANGSRFQNGRRNGR